MVTRLRSTRCALIRFMLSRFISGFSIVSCSPSKAPGRTAVRQREDRGAQLGSAHMAERFHTSGFEPAQDFIFGMDIRLDAEDCLEIPKESTGRPATVDAKNLARGVT